MKIRDRIRELRRVPAKSLLPNPLNWRLHPQAQQNALRGVLAEIGFADACLARELPDGSLMLIDGHLRAETAPDADVPVLILDLDENEAAKLLATLDPLAAMAEPDPAKLDMLLRDIQTGNEDLAAMLTGLAEEAGLVPGEAKPRGQAIDPEYSILIKCDDEAEQRILIEELDNHGLYTRALCIGWPQQPPVERGEDIPLAVDEKRIVRKSTIKQSPRIKQLAGIYDLPPKTESEQTWIVKFTLDRPWHIGLIVGPSGSGKTTIAREIFGDKIVTGWAWPEDRSIIDGFPETAAIGDIVNLLSSVGFSSPPHWLKPFHVLSNGEQFRVNLARTMAEMPDLAVIDEFTSVVDRTVAQIGSAAVAKAVRAANRRHKLTTDATPIRTDRSVALGLPAFWQTGGSCRGRIAIATDDIGHCRGDRCFDFDSESQVVGIHRLYSAFRVSFRPIDSIYYIPSFGWAQQQNGLKQAEFQPFAKSNAGLPMRWRLPDQALAVAA